MSLYDILACPTCKVHVTRRGDGLNCGQCGRAYPIVNGVPVMMPDGSVPGVQHEAELVVRDSYVPWVFRTILQSLLDDQWVLEIGSGNMRLDDPCIIRMDVTLTPYVDVVADAHHLPFVPGSLDYVFSMAVFEHLRNPFQAAQSIHEALKDGGFIYHECNFVFAYHGYPHHYFNASLQGLEQLFAAFRPLRKGVAPYQMPSFAVGMILRTFLHHTQAHRYPHGRRLTSLLHHVVALDLTEFDIYFKEEEALKLAAGTYYAGVKEVTPTSTLVPAPIRDLWQQDAGLQRRFPDLNQLTTTDNILTWAKTEGRRQHAEVARCLDAIAPAHKRGAGAPWDRGPIHALPLIEPLYGAIGFDPTNTMAENARVAVKRPGPSLYTRLRRRASRVPLLRRLYAAVVKQGGA
jgi:uncharacterized protein YbaR (Trm112 family)/SAM-dependent methyltransferase